MSGLPVAHFGSADEAHVDWRNAPDVDPDDEQIKTPKDVLMMLGFDPADEREGEDLDSSKLDAAMTAMATPPNPKTFPTTIKAAGVLIMAKGRALFVKRAAASDHAGEWCFPGGIIEDGEDAEAAARREVVEEVGQAGLGDLALWARRINTDQIGNAPGEEVDYTTFLAKVDELFTPALNGEHTAFAWASPTDPPEPLHPGVRVALAKLSANELDIARMMVGGDLVSPQKYGNFWLFDIRITGTGFAYRGPDKDAKGKVLRGEEITWRDPALYLTDDMLARCNGLPVVFYHPEEKPTLDSDEYNSRSVGTVFLPYIRGEEIWGIAKVYDQATVDLMLSKQVSTSPGVLLDAQSGGSRFERSDGPPLMIEGLPALIDHIAICHAGVWDRGGPPSGVNSTGGYMTEKTDGGEVRTDTAIMSALDAIRDSLKRTDARLDAMDEERAKAEKDRKDATGKAARLDAARKDRFGARKDAERYKDYKKRHDDDEAAMCDAMRKDGTEEEEARKAAKDARRDAEAAERRADASFGEWAKEEEEEKEHKDAKKDGDAPDLNKSNERMDARHDTQAATIATLSTNLDALRAQLRALTTPQSDDERAALSVAQARADALAGQFGERAPVPVPGETSLAYRRRLAGKFQAHSKHFAKTRLDGFDADALGPVEDIIYHDASEAALHPKEGSLPGTLIAIPERDVAGRQITRYTGDIGSWMGAFSSEGLRGRVMRPSGVH